MKTLASLLLISATFLGTNTYAQEPSSALEYRPVVSQISSVTRVQVVREIQAVEVGSLAGFNGIGQPVGDVAGDSITFEAIRVQAITVDVIGVTPFRDESRETALNTSDDVALDDSGEAADQIAAGEPADDAVIAEASAVDVIGIYPDGDQSYKSAFSVVHFPRG